MSAGLPYGCRDMSWRQNTLDAGCFEACFRSLRCARRDDGSENGSSDGIVLGVSRLTYRGRLVLEICPLVVATRNAP